MKTKALTPVRVILVSIFSLVVVTFSMLTFKPWLHITSIEVTGAQEDTAQQVDLIVQEYLSGRVLFTLPRKHAWLYSPEKLEELLLMEAPLNAVGFKRTKHSLHISLSEKVRTFYLEHNDVIYAVDRSGIVLGPIPDVERIRIELGEGTEGVPLIRDSRSSVIAEGKEGLAVEQLEGIVELLDLIKSRTLLSPERIEISDEEGRVDVLTDAGVSLYVTFDRELDSQVEKLETLIDRKLIDINELTYIDLRFENRLFYH